MKTKTTYIASFLALTSFAHGAITWGTVTDISTNFATFESSVANNGTFVSAYNFGSVTTSVTINSVTFTGKGTSSTTGYNNVTNSFAITPAANGTAGADSTGTNTANYDGGVAAFDNLGADQKTLLSGYITGSTGGNPQGHKVELQGLTVSQTYQIQIWVSDSRAFTSTDLDKKGGILDGAISFDHNTTDVTGGLGQYVTGTFTAGSDKESFTYIGTTDNGTGFIPLNAFSLRAIPEPSAVLLGSLGLCGLLLRRRR